MHTSSNSAHPGQEVAVTGIDNHQIDSLKVVNASAKIFMQRGEAIGIFQQCAYLLEESKCHGTSERPDKTTPTVSTRTNTSSATSG